MDEKEEKWQTAVTNIEPNDIQLRGYSIQDLMGEISFAEGIYLALKGELPGESEGKIMNAILVSSIDHGTTPPSAQSSITVASTGAPMNASVSAGVLAISNYHGGAIEEAMKAVGKALDKSGEDFEEKASKMIEDYKKSGKRVSGFGHRIHTEDPRAKKLFSLSEEEEIAGEGVAMAKAIEKALHKAVGKKLPVNVDGAIGAVLYDMDFNPRIANTFFMMSRMPGLVAHVDEEKSRYKPMRKINHLASEYDGPSKRKPEENR